MKNYTFTLNDGLKLNRVSKQTAKKLFLAGVKVRLYPCNANPLSPWFSGYGLSLENFDYNNGVKENPADFFDYMVNSFIYYNCNNELGKYPAFYTES